MRARTKGWGVLLLGVAVAWAAPARAAEQPLLVVVEAAPGLELDAGQVRRAIGAELRASTVAPARAGEDDPARALIVSVDRERITMSLREAETAPVARAVAAPADPPARLRVIAWLAGNLARDQVSGLVASPAEAPTASPSIAPSPVPSLPAREASPAVAETPPDLAPPPFVAPAATVTTNAEAKSSRPAGWTIQVTAGPAFSMYTTGRVLHQSITGQGSFTNLAPDIYSDRGTLWRAEARHRAEGSRHFSGVALEGAAVGEPRQLVPAVDEVVGAMAFIGAGRQWGRWSLEATIGAGISLVKEQQPTYTISASEGGHQLATTYDIGLGPDLFAAGSLAAAHPLGDTIDAVLTFDLHDSVVDWEAGFFAFTVGLRYRL